MKRKGFTLAEIAVVLALSAILMAALISLIATVGKYVNIRKAERAEANELKTIETVFNGLTDFDGADYTFTVVGLRHIPAEHKYTSEINITKTYENDSGETIVADVNSLVYSLDVGADEYAIRTLSFGENKITLGSVGDITFEGRDGLLKCTVEGAAVYMLSVRAASVAAEA